MSVLNIGDVSALTLLEKAKLSVDKIREIYRDLSTPAAKSLALKILRTRQLTTLAEELEAELQGACAAA